MAYVCQFEPIPSIVKGGSNFSTFGTGEPPRGHPTKQPSTTILRGINLMNLVAHLEGLSHLVATCK
jgi:hypothetical protein